MNLNKVYIGILLVSCIAITAMIMGCTENARVKALGGAMIVRLPKGKELVTATWKDCNLWYLLKNRDSNKDPQVYEFIEKSNQGILEGKVVFEEQ